MHNCQEESGGNESKKVRHTKHVFGFVQSNGCRRMVQNAVSNCTTSCFAGVFHRSSRVTVSVPLDRVLPFGREREALCVLETCRVKNDHWDWVRIAAPRIHVLFGDSCGLLAG